MPEERLNYRGCSRRVVVVGVSVDFIVSHSRFCDYSTVRKQ